MSPFIAVLVALFVATTALVVNAQQAERAQAAGKPQPPGKPQPQLGANFVQGSQSAQDGMVFAGQIKGETGSSARLILAEDYTASGRLRWQSSDDTLGAVDVDFFRPKDIRFRGKRKRQVIFDDMEPAPRLSGTIFLAPQNRAIVNVGIKRDNVRYVLQLVDIGIELSGEDLGQGTRVPHSAVAISSGNFAQRSCTLQKLRVTGLGKAVLDVSTPGIVEIFDPSGSKLGFPVHLKSLPADLLLSGHALGTTTINAIYTLPDTTTLSKRRNVSVEVTPGGAAEADCIASP